MFKIRTILLPTDFSDASESAYHAACSLARQHRARLIVVHVLETPAAAYLGGPVIPELSVELEEIRAKLGNLCGAADVPAERRLLGGEPVAEILRAARDEHCDLIVMGTHGRTGLSRVFLGSVAERVLRRSGVPVLVVKAGAPEAEAAEPVIRTAGRVRGDAAAAAGGRHDG